MFAGFPIDGIHCETMEGTVEHIHTHLQIFDRGRNVVVPALIGIPAGGGCLYWLHTHAADGIIHIESPVRRQFTLGQFFDIWMQTLSATQAYTVKAPHGQQLSFWVNGVRYHGDPRNIVLRDREEIVIQNGPPFAKPARYDWSHV